MFNVVQTMFKRQESIDMIKCYFWIIGGSLRPKYSARNLEIPNIRNSLEGGEMGFGCPDQVEWDRIDYSCVFYGILSQKQTFLDVQKVF